MSTAKRFSLLLLAVVALLAPSGIRAAAVLTVTCGTVVQNINSTTPDYAVAITCVDGMSFNGTVSLVNAGDPSDLLVKGSWTDPAGGMLVDTFDYSLDDYTLPVGPKVMGWHVLQGSMNLHNANATAQLSVVGTLTGASKVPCATGNVATGFINGTFNVSSVPVPCMDMPNWTREADYTADFDNNVGRNSTITLGAGQGDNFWAGVPEPSEFLLLLTGAAVLLPWLRRARARRS